MSNENNKETGFKIQSKRGFNYCSCLAFNIINIVSGLLKDQAVSTLIKNQQLTFKYFIKWTLF